MPRMRTPEYHAQPTVSICFKYFLSVFVFVTKRQVSIYKETHEKAIDVWTNIV